MIREPIFDIDIDIIENEKLTDISIGASSIKEENYAKLTEILKSNSQLESVSTHIKDGNDKFWNKFFKIFMPEEGEFALDPSKIVLSGDIDKFNCDIYKYIENVEMRLPDIKKIRGIESKLPNLKNIDLEENCVFKKEVGDNIEDFCEVAKYIKTIQIDQELGKEIKDKLSENLILSEDGTCIINMNKIEQKSVEPKDLRISLSDLEKIGLDRLQQSGDKITLVINSANELSNIRIQELQNAGLNIEGVRIFTEENGPSQNKIYDLQTYNAVREKLEELVEGIDINATDKEKFAEVYKRVCANITYDTPAAYPATAAEEKYSNEQVSNCRNLKNGLLEGKCVCAGYADILRNALSMVGVESKYIPGVVYKKEIEEKNFDEKKYSESYVEKREDGKVIIGEHHAWNKVKLDGIWYNVDPTWDSTKIRLGQIPTHCLKTDEQIGKKERKINFSGPECESSVEDRDIEEMFGIKHLHIGKMQIPNGKDILAGIKLVGEAYKEIGVSIKNKVINLKDKLLGDNVPQLPSPKKLEEIKTNKSISENPWDLKNYGIDEKKFRSDTNKIINNLKDRPTNTNDSKDFENEK